MNCSLCQKPAVYNPPRFCKEHFVRHYEKTVVDYFKASRVKDARVLVGVSGGKDSSALAWALGKVGLRFGLTFALFTIDLGILKYSKQSVAAAAALAQKMDVELIVERPPRTIPPFVEGKVPCSACGTIKRYLLNKAALERGFDYVATGHNLDDEYYFAVHALEHAQTSMLVRNEKSLRPRPERRLAGRLKPLYYLTERENMTYCLVEGLPIHNEECPYSVGNPQLTFKLERPAPRETKKNVVRTLARLKRASPEEIAGGDDGADVHPCPGCGYPTTRDDACGYCRIVHH